MNLIASMVRTAAYLLLLFGCQSKFDEDHVPFFRGPQPEVEDLYLTNLDTNMESIVTLPYFDPDGRLADSCEIVRTSQVTESTSCTCLAGSCSVGVTSTANFVGSGYFDFKISISGIASTSARARFNILPRPSLGFALRKLRNNYSGSAVRVRRTPGNEEIDIGFDEDGNLDVTSLLAFTAGGDGNAFVATWYDQSGNGFDASQSTATDQPAIVTSNSVVLQNGLPSLDFDGTNDYLALSGAALDVSKNVSFVSMYGVAKTDLITSTPSGRWLFGATVNGSPGNTRFGLAEAYTANRYLARGRRLDADTVEYADSSTDHGTLLRQITGVIEYQNVIAFIRQDGVQVGINSGFQTPGSTSNTTSDSIQIGRVGNVSTYFDGQISEFILHTTDQGSNMTFIEGDQKNYYSTP